MLTLVILCLTAGAVVGLDEQQEDIKAVVTVPGYITFVAASSPHYLELAYGFNKTSSQIDTQSATLWKNAPRPNYSTNTDKEYPYSELPFVGEYDLVQIPRSFDELIDHVDYWGEGRVASQQGVSGFPNTYNVNFAYQLVSDGADKGKKIPNRIPVDSYADCDTRAYIKDNSVATVTVMGQPIDGNCAIDIARIVNYDVGKVIVFGSDCSSNKIDKLMVELQKKLLYQCPDCELPTELQEITNFNCHVTFLNAELIKEELIKHFSNDNYDKAVKLIKKYVSQAESGSSKKIHEVIRNLLNSKSDGNFKLMSFVYKLWNNGGKDIVKKYFPDTFALILGQKDVTIVNNEYKQALKLGVALDSDNDRLAWGHNGEKTIKQVKWQFIPEWSNNEVIFKIYHVDTNMYLKLAVNCDNMGDRRIYGSTSSDTFRHKFYVEPYTHNDGTLAFLIINHQYRQGLKLGVAKDRMGDRAVYGHNGDIYKEGDRHQWSIIAW